MPREERAEVAKELLATLEPVDDSDEARYAALRAAVDKGIASLDARRSIRIPAGGIGEYLRERGRLATERANAKRA